MYKISYQSFATKYFNKDDYFFNYPIEISSLYYFLFTNFKYKTLLRTKSIVTLHTNSMAQLKAWVTSKVPYAFFFLV